MQEAANKLAPRNQPRPKWSLWSRVLVMLSIPIFVVGTPVLLKSYFGLDHLQYTSGTITAPTRPFEPLQPNVAQDQKYSFDGRVVAVASVYGMLLIQTHSQSMAHEDGTLVRDAMKPGWASYHIPRNELGQLNHLPLLEFRDLRNWEFVGFGVNSTSPDHQEIVLPLYILIPLTAPALPIFLLRRRRLHRWRNNQCYHCGYPRPAMDAALEASHKCSECGKTDESDTPPNPTPPKPSLPDPSVAT